MVAWWCWWCGGAGGAGGVGGEGGVVVLGVKMVWWCCL